MLVGCDLEIARFALGWRNPPSPRQLRTAVRRFGLMLGERLPVRSLRDCRGRGLVLLRQRGANPRGLGHVAVLAAGGQVHDPALARAVPAPRYPRHLKRMGLSVKWWIPAYVREA
jgi:hypothetical protein